MTARTIFYALAALVILPAGQPLAQQDQTREQYVYVLQVAPRFQKEVSWTDTENAAVAQHFERLAQAADSGKVILAGRTAKEFMDSDPVVIAGLMTATLHPYAVALQRK